VCVCVFKFILNIFYTEVSIVTSLRGILKIYYAAEWEFK